MFTTHRHLALLGGGVLAALVVAFHAAPAGSAQKKKEPQAVSNAQLTEALTTLGKVKHILENADHDYGGHRAAAVRDVGAAQHQLRLALGIKAPKKNKDKDKDAKNPMPEPQDVSDKQLAAAIPIFKQAVTVLKSADHDYMGHRADAVRDLEAAITQLGKALEYRAKKAESKN
jgi:hypothetical protein